MKQLYLPIILFFSLFGITGCLNDPDGEAGVVNGGMPELAEVESGEKTATSIVVSGEITKKNGIPVVEYGFVWAKIQNGEEGEENSVVAGTDNEHTRFSYKIENLDNDSYYKIRAYAVNRSEQTGYSQEYTFTTNAGIGTVTTLQPANIRGTTVLAGGKIMDPGEGEIIKREVHLLDSDRNFQQRFSSSMEADSFTCLLTGLEPLTEYYAVAYVENLYGRFISDTLSFTTGDGLPIIRIMEIIPDYTEVEFTIEISDPGDSEITEKGILWSPTEAFEDDRDSIFISASDNIFKLNIRELTANKLYYARAYAINAFGMACSTDTLFSTKKDVPTVVTNEIDLETLLDGSVVISGNVLDEGKNPPVLDAGICWSTDKNKLDIVNANVIYISSGLGYFEEVMTGLRGGETYYIRAFATAQHAIGYGDVVEFTTPDIFSVRSAPEASYAMVQNSAASFTAEEKGYLLGGDLGSEFTNVLQMYDPADNKWYYKQAPSPVKRKYQSAAYNGNLVYILGGQDESNEVKDEFYWYSIRDNRYELISTAANKPAPLYYALALPVGNTICYLGGNKGTTITNEVWVYDSGSDSFVSKTSLSESQYGGVAVTVGDRIYAGLGLTNQAGTTFTTRFWSSTETLERWNTETPFPGSKIVRGGAALDKMIYVIDDDLYIWQYNTESGTWLKKSRYPGNKSSVYCMWSLNGDIYIGVGDILSGNEFYKYDPVWDN